MNPYFFDGYHAEYGLYDVINNRFVVVSSDLDTLTRCILVLSSKAHLYIVPLTRAINYNPTLIDNYCCSNWGLGDVQGTDLYTESESPAHLVIDPVPDLVENTKPVNEIEHELRQFAFLTHSVIEYWRRNSSWYYRDYYDFVAWPDSLKQLKESEQSMYHAIYLAVDYDSAEARVQELMC